MATQSQYVWWGYATPDGAKLSPHPPPYRQQQMQTSYPSFAEEGVFRGRSSVRGTCIFGDVVVPPENNGEVLREKEIISSSENAQYGVDSDKVDDDEVL